MINNQSFMTKLSELAREYGYAISFKISEHDADNFVIWVFNDDVRGWRTVDLGASEYTILKVVERLVVSTNRIEKREKSIRNGEIEL